MYELNANHAKNLYIDSVADGGNLSGVMYVQSSRGNPVPYGKIFSRIDKSYFWGV